MRSPSGIAEAEPLNTDGVIAVSVVTSSVAAFLVGCLVGALIHHCVTKRSKPQRTEVTHEIVMKENVAYKQVNIE